MIEINRQTQLVGAIKFGIDKLRLAWLALSVTVVLAACQQNAEQPFNPEPPAAESVPETAVSEADATHSPIPKTELSAAGAATQTVLERFATSSDPSWDDFSELPGVTWSETAPVSAPGAPGLKNPISRSGKIEWVDVLTRTGSGLKSSDTRGKDEREVGLTLLGEREGIVHMIAFRKYRASTEYEAMILAQLGDDAKLRRIADRCARNYGSRSGNTRGTAFFELRLDQETALYVESYADKDGGKYGPGYTTFEFSRTRPDARIADMGCVQS